MNRLSLVMLLGLVAQPLLAADCVVTTDAVSAMARQPVRVVNTAGKELSIEVRIADEPRERYAGFQHLCPAPPQTPMLFVFEAAVFTAFHMRNVHQPLDIAFIADDGSFLEVMRMEPGSRLYSPQRPFRYALEAPAGSFTRLGLGVGSRLKTGDGLR